MNEHAVWHIQNSASTNTLQPTERVCEQNKVNSPQGAHRSAELGSTVEWTAFTISSGQNTAHTASYHDYSIGRAESDVKYCMSSQFTRDMYYLLDTVIT